MKKFNHLREVIERNLDRYGKFIRVGEEGMVLGEKVILGTDTARTASIMALTPVDMMVVHKKYFASIKDLFRQIS